MVLLYKSALSKDNCRRQNSKPFSILCWLKSIKNLLNLYVDKGSYKHTGEGEKQIYMRF